MEASGLPLLAISLILRVPLGIDVIKSFNRLLWDLRAHKHSGWNMFLGRDAGHHGHT